MFDWMAEVMVASTISDWMAVQLVALTVGLRVDLIAEQTAASMTVLLAEWTIY